MTNLAFIASELETFVYQKSSNFDAISRWTDSLKTLYLLYPGPTDHHLVFKSVKNLYLRSKFKLPILSFSSMFPMAERIYVRDACDEKFDVIPYIQNIGNSRQENWKYIAYWKQEGFSESDIDYLRKKEDLETNRIIVRKSPDGEISWKSLTEDEIIELQDFHLEKAIFHLI